MAPRHFHSFPSMVRFCQLCVAFHHLMNVVALQAEDERTCAVPGAGSASAGQVVRENVMLQTDKLRQRTASIAALRAAASCCEKCGRETYCSPNSGNCYWSRNKDYYETCREPVELENPMTVLSYNVMYTNFPNNLGGVAYNINSNLKPDVMGNQECMNMGAMQRALGSELRAAPDTHTFNCIFYKPSSGISDGGESGHVYLGDGNRDNYSKRYFSYAKLVRNGITFWVFSTHWCIRGPCSGDEAGRRHEDSARRMLQYREELGAGDTPTIIVGDLNSHMNGLDNDRGVQYFLNNGFEMAGKSDLWGGIDYVFVSRGHWKIGETFVGAFGGSDHKPIQVEIDFVDGEGSSAPATSTSTTMSTTATTSVSTTSAVRTTATTTCSDHPTPVSTTSQPATRAWCCSKCGGAQPFCSPNSGNCYDTQAKNYYAPCDAPTTNTSEAWCCAKCGGGYCSPNSGNCYSSKQKDYYAACSTSLVDMHSTK